jgi:hypothetical protein
MKSTARAHYKYARGVITAKNMLDNPLGRAQARFRERRQATKSKADDC